MSSPRPDRLTNSAAAEAASLMASKRLGNLSSVVSSVNEAWPFQKPSGYGCKVQDARKLTGSPDGVTRPLPACQEKQESGVRSQNPEEKLGPLVSVLLFS